MGDKWGQAKCKFSFERSVFIRIMNCICCSQLLSRQMRLLLSWFLSLQSPLRIRQRLSNAFEKANKRSLQIDGSDLQAINIGEIDINDDGLTAEEPAWDGEDDPFYHLTPGERMDVLRTMSLQDIYKSAVNRKEQNQKQKMKRFGSSRKGAFKKPDY